MERKKVIEGFLDKDDLSDWINKRTPEDHAVRVVLEGFSNYLCGGKADGKAGAGASVVKEKPRELCISDGFYFEAIECYRKLKDQLRKERDLPENKNEKYKYNRIISAVNQDIECIKQAALTYVRPASCMTDFVEPDYDYFSYENPEHVRMALMLDRGKIKENSSLRYIVMDIDRKIKSVDLNETERTVYLLFREGYGYSQAEIARLLQKNRQNIGNVLRRIAEKIVEQEKG